MANMPYSARNPTSRETDSCHATSCLTFEGFERLIRIHAGTTNDLVHF